jgi:purine-nucleoside phosphorylase
MFKEIKESADYLSARLKKNPKAGIVLGTGLGGLVDDIEVELEVSYEDIPHFPLSTVESHSGKLIFGTIEGVQVVVMQGRFHFYEGYSMDQVVFPIRVMKVLGIMDLFISNAAGGINPSFDRGDLVIIEDQINQFPTNPLIGQNIDELGPRFPDMSAPFDPDYVKKALGVAQELDIDVKKGVYVGLPGPMLETPAEYKYLSRIGADLVGMSTVPEVIAARHMSLRTFACSIVTDVCYGEIKKVNIQDIIETAMSAEPALTVLIKTLIKKVN